jgi:DNA-binding SARP family transcriptional activator
MAQRRNLPAIQIYLLGGFRFVVNGRSMTERAWGRHKPLQLLKCLLTRPNRRMLEGEAAELFFPDSGDAARSTIGSTLSTIRSKLGWSKEDGTADLLSRDHGVLSILPEAGVWLDADEFEDLLRRAKTADNPCPLLEEADRLYAGEYLPDDLYEDWARERRGHLTRLHVELQFELSRCREQRGDVAGAEAALESVLHEDRYDERATRELMVLLALHDRRPKALRVYQTLVKALEDELGFEPSQETVDCYEGIRSGASVAPRPVAPTQPPPPLPVQPDPGPAPIGHGPGEEPLDLSRFMPAYPFPAPELLVGRQAELATLEKILEAGLTRGQVVLVSAPAGTGKSALLGALVQRARRSGFLCLVGGGYEGNSVIPLGPFHDALADFLLWQPAEQVKAESAGGLDDLALLIPELLQHLSLPDRPASDPATAQLRLRAALHMYLRRLAERQPVLLCLEDLHAADETTLATIVSLVQQLGHHRVVIVGTFRTDELRPGRPLPDWVTEIRRRGAAQLDLRPLNRQHTDRMVASLLDGKPSDRLVDALHNTTDGNPLFVEQLVLALREEGRIDQRNGTWRQIGDISGVPTIIRDLIGQRLDRLSKQARQTLALASVMGRAFEYGALLAAAETDDEHDVMEALDEAFEALILHDTPTGYAFGHAMHREVVYARLTTGRKMMLHEKAGHGLERWAGDRANEHAAELARHFSLSARKPELRQKALYYSLEAGRRATALSARRDALTFFTQACELVESLGEAADASAHVDALEGRALGQRDLAQWPSCIESARHLVELCDDPIRRASAHGMIGYAHHHIGETAAALAATDAGLADLTGVAEPEQPTTIAARLHLQHQKSIILFLGGQYDEVERLGAQMVHDATLLGQPRPLFWAHTSLGWAYLGQGILDPGIEQCELACAAAERFGQKVQLAIAEENLALQLMAAGRFPAARASLERGIELFSDAAGEVRAVNSIRLLARVHLAEGNLEAARQSAERACDLVLEGAMRWSAECNDALGAIHAIQCDWETARLGFERALAVRQKVAYPAGSVDTLIGLGQVDEALGDWPQALTSYANAAEAADTAMPGPRYLAAHRVYGRLLLRRGELGPATTQLSLALKLAEQRPTLVESAAAFLAGAELAIATGDVDSALRYVERANDGPTTAEVAVQVHLARATTWLLAGRVGEARPLVSDAQEVARRLATPYVLGLAHLATGRLAAVEELQAEASAAFQTAEKQFGIARMPFARAVALLERSHLADECARARQMRADAFDILEQLGARAEPPCADRVDTVRPVPLALVP